MERGAEEEEKGVQKGLQIRRLSISSYWLQSYEWLMFLVSLFNAEEEES